MAERRRRAHETDIPTRPFDGTEALAPGRRLGHYEIVGLLGAGGMGRVYRARDPRLERDVALKVLPAAADPEWGRRFDREARAASALNHPNVVVVHDVGSDGSLRYVVTELVEGETLRHRLSRGPLPLAECLEQARQIAAGLSAAHEKGIVHRDLKPENIMVTREGRMKILDFGLAKRTAPLAEPHGSLATQPGVILGTAGYMSPEQVRGEEADRRTDVFSVGAVLYEMLTGRRAFAGGSQAETLLAVLNEEPPPLKNACPTALAAAIERCLRKRPDERFASARELQRALDGISSLATEESGRPSVAVLPFRDLSGDPANEHLGLGLADATITELANIKAILVRPTSAILRYLGRSVDASGAGRELGVDAVVEARYQRAGTRLRVTVQLVGTRDARPLWASKIDASLDDVFGMQDEVSRNIARALEVELTPAEERRRRQLAASARPGGEAYEAYLKGRAQLLRETLEDVNAAIECFERATETDPGFVLAWAGLADAYAKLAYDFNPEGQWYERAQEACARALDLDPDLAETHYVRARLLWSPSGRWDHAGALRALKKVLAARPGLAEARDLLGLALFHMGLLDEAYGEFEQGLLANPDDPYARLHFASCRYHQGRFEEALELALAAARRAPAPWPHNLIALSQIQLGRLNAAEETLIRMTRAFPAYVPTHSLLGLVAALRGDAGGAQRQIDLTVQNRRAFGHYHHAQYDVACIHAHFGRIEEALDWLREAAGNGYPCRPFFEIDPLLAPLRASGRFKRLMDELRAECDGYAKIYAEIRAGSGPPAPQSLS
jgi:serine/threonine protein kinase/Tfp pilus assembly protein PilF